MHTCFCAQGTRARARNGAVAQTWNTWRATLWPLQRRLVHRRGRNDTAPACSISSPQGRMAVAVSGQQHASSSHIRNTCHWQCAHNVHTTAVNSAPTPRATRSAPCHACLLKYIHPPAHHRHEHHHSALDSSMHAFTGPSRSMANTPPDRASTLPGRVQPIRPPQCRSTRGPFFSSTVVADAERGTANQAICTAAIATTCVLPSGFLSELIYDTLWGPIDQDRIYRTYPAIYDQFARSDA